MYSSRAIKYCYQFQITNFCVFILQYYTAEFFTHSET